MTDAADLGPLPGGHHGLSRDQIVESQRERLLAAIVSEVAANGYRSVKIADVVKVASVSTRDFYALFEDKEACFLSAFDVVRDHLEDLIRGAVRAAESWNDRVVAAIGTALGFLAAEPDLARFCLLEAQHGTPRTAIRFREAVLTAVPFLAEGRDELGAGGIPARTEEAVIGGVISLVTATVVARETEALPDLLPLLGEFALSPYMDRRGTEAGQPS